ncbi:3-phenylpropionate/cinnamic acid dioxygenase subunit beta [Bordetella sp. 2513F-2]
MNAQHTPEIAMLLLEREIERFYFAEADLLDERRFADWLALFTDDVRYWMPLARNVQYRHSQDEYSREGVDNAWIDEDKRTLGQRVQQLATGIHWAEEPRSRMSHLITNVRILDAGSLGPSPQELSVRCRFLVYRNRMETEVDILVGKRQDVLRRVDGEWKIARREIFLDQNVLLAKNLTTFF